MFRLFFCCCDSFKRPNNAQGGQSRVSVGAANSESANPSSQQRGIQNGVHTQPSSHGMNENCFSFLVLYFCDEIVVFLFYRFYRY